jgi:hypothetical protein
MKPQEPQMEAPENTPALHYLQETKGVSYEERKSCKNLGY